MRNAVASSAEEDPAGGIVRGVPDLGAVCSGGGIGIGIGIEAKTAKIFKRLCARSTQVTEQRRYLMLRYEYHVSPKAGFANVTLISCTNELLLVSSFCQAGYTLTGADPRGSADLRI